MRARPHLVVALAAAFGCGGEGRPGASGDGSGDGSSGVAPPLDASGSSSTSSESSTREGTDGSASASSTDSGGATPCSEVVEGDLELDAQADLEAVRSVREIEGTLAITGSVVDLEALGCLESIRGSLQIHDTAGLGDLSGLEGLTHVGGQLWVARNPDLASLDGLSSLRFASWINLSHNGITHLGLPALQATDSITIGDCLPEDEGEPLLEDLDGLDALLALTTVSVHHAPNLAALSGLQAFAERGGSVAIVKLWFNEQLDPATIDALTDADPGISLDACGNAGQSTERCWCPPPP